MSARILVADDSVTIQKVVELTFSKEDFTLTQARSGEEAIRKAKEVRPDLVLLDLVMPDMNGYDVCAALRREPALRNVPIILLAGTFESFDQQRGKQVGANDFVTKPFESQALIGKVKQCLFAKAMEAGAMAKPGWSPEEAITVRLSRTPAAPPAVSLAPTATAFVEESLAPPPLVPPQEKLWQPPDSVSVPVSAGDKRPEPSNAAGPGQPISLGAAGEPEGLPLDLSALDLDSLPALNGAADEPVDLLPLPESLSLDDLLAASPEVPVTASALETGKEDATTVQPVFELAATEMPSLPMVEAGKGEPPTLSMEELLSSPVVEVAAADNTELPVLELTALAAPNDPPATEAEPDRPTWLETADMFSELPLSDAAGLSHDVDATEAASGVGTFEFSAPPSTPPPLSKAPDTIPEVPVLDMGHAYPEEPEAILPSATSVAAPLLEEVTPPTPIGVMPAEMAAMREAVTERVAQDLRRELSEKLLDRFEKIVWEVVPDLAEILITKEIERIQRLVEKERPS